MNKISKFQARTGPDHGLGRLTRVLAVVMCSAHVATCYGNACRQKTPLRPSVTARHTGLGHPRAPGGPRRGGRSRDSACFPMAAGCLSLSATHSTGELLPLDSVSLLSLLSQVLTRVTAQTHYLTVLAVASPSWAGRAGSCRTLRRTLHLPACPAPRGRPCAPAGGPTPSQLLLLSSLSFPDPDFLSPLLRSPVDHPAS